MENENKVIPTTNNAEILENEVLQEKEITEMDPTPETNPEEKRCPNCQALLTEEQNFCPECGTSFKKLCSNCKTELQEGQAFCPSCGQKNTDEIAQATSSIEQFNQNIVNNGVKANKKKKILSVIGIVLVVAAVISYFVFQNMKVSEYKENAKTFCSTVLSSAANLEGIGNEIKSEWYDYIYDSWSIYDSIDEAVAGALSNKSDEIANAKTEKIIIDGLYSKLKKPVNKSDEIEELCEAVKVLYDEYEDFYDFVTDPSGNYNSFKSKFGELDSSIVEAYEDLKDLCDDLN